MRLMSFEIATCAGAELDWMLGTGVGASSPSTGDATWVALRGALLVGYRLTQAWGIRLDLGGGAPLERPAFVVQGFQGGLVHKPAGVTGRATAGVELRF
jgi:hypothetical protein